MSAEIISNIDGIVTAKITGKLTYAELTELQKAMIKIIGQQGGVRLLIVSENFQGWDNAGNWGDVSFMSTSDPYINKMAIVGEKKWEEMTLMFTAKGLREFPIEYFQTDELSKAVAWLAEV